MNEDLMVRLEKTAGLKKYLGDVTGINAAKAKKGFEEAKGVFKSQLKEKTDDHAPDYAARAKAGEEYSQALKDKSKAQKVTAGAAAGAGTIGGSFGAGYAAGKHDKEASELIERLEKTAGLGGVIKGVGTYLKNVTGTGVRQAQKSLDNVSPLPTAQNNAARDLLKKDLHNAKVDRNIAMAGTAGVGMLGGAGLGGYSAYQKSKEPVVTDLMDQNQITQQPKLAAENLMDRLEKTANDAGYGQSADYQNRMADKRINEIMVDLMQTKPEYLEHALAQEGLLDRAVERGVFQDPTVGEGAATGGIVGGLAGGMGGALAAGFGGEDLKSVGKYGLGGALVGGGLLAGVGAAEGLYRKFHPSEMHLKYHGGGDDQQPTAPDVMPAHEENPRQGAGSVSHAPAGADKSASELMERLEKTAAEWKEDGKAGAELGSYIMGVPSALAGGVGGAIAGGQKGGPVGALLGGLGGATGGGLVGAGMGAAGGGITGMMYGGAKDITGYKPTEGKSHMPSTALAGAGVAGVTAGLQGAVMGGTRGAILNGLGGAATGAIAGAGIGAMRDHREGIGEEQTASNDDLMDRLEKTAAGIPGISAIAGKLKNFAGNVTGKNLKAAKQTSLNADETLRAWNTPEALKANSPQMGVAKFREHLEGLDSAAKGAAANVAKVQKDTKIARGATAGVAGVGAIGTGVAAASKDDNQMKVASVDEDTLSGLFKEAAAAIIDEKLPPVKQHVDPMSRIKF